MKAILFVLTFLIPIQSFALDCIPKDPEHQAMRIYENDALPMAMTQANFVAILGHFEKFWQPHVNKLGAQLHMNNKWSDGEINSDAYEQGSQWYIDAYGGLARFPGESTLAYYNVLCHELGHHLGGAPRFNGNSDWAAVEGQADYWSTIHCMKSMGFKDAEIAQAALDNTRVLAKLGGERMPSHTARDKSVVKRTVEDHPHAQCRLDTYDAGRECAASGVTSNHDPKKNTCYAYPGGKAGVGDRPLCWYKP